MTRELARDSRETDAATSAKRRGQARAVVTSAR